MRAELDLASGLHIKLDGILRISYDTKICARPLMDDSGSDLDRLLLWLKISVDRLEARKRLFATMPDGELHAWNQTHGLAAEKACSECIDAIIRLQLPLKLEE